jgi:hypothetical protein
MQIVVTIVQNAVDRRHMGTATSSVAFFRSLGGTFGAAAFGAILYARLATHVSETLGSAAGQLGGATSDVQRIQGLPEPVKGLVLQAFAHSLDDMFLWAIPVVLVALVVSVFIKEMPLKSRQAAAESSAVGDPEEIALTH